MGKLLLTLSLLALLGVLSNPVHFRGNLLFKEYGANYLNQDHLVLSRKLETSDLQKFAQAYQASAEIYKFFCDSIIRYFYQLNPEKEIPPNYDPNQNYTFIVSKQPFKISRAAEVCRQLSASLPEIRSRSDDAQVLALADRYKITTLMSNIQFDVKGQFFFWGSDLSPVSTSNVYNVPYYGGQYTDGWYQSKSWSDDTLLRDATSFYMTFVRARDGMAFRLSDSKTLQSFEHIICQKPIKRPPKEVSLETNILIQVAMGSCKRDEYSVMESTRHTIDQIHLITTLKLNITKNSTAMDNYLPKFQFSAKSKRDIVSSEQKTLHSPLISPTLQKNPFNSTTANMPPQSFSIEMPCRILNSAKDFWDPLYMENYFSYPLTMIPHYAKSFTDLYEKSYQFWFHLQSKFLTTKTFSEYLDKELANANISYCGSSIKHVQFKSDKKLDGPFPHSLDLFKQNQEINSLNEQIDPFVLDSETRPARDLGSATVIGTLVGGTALVIKSFIDLLTGNSYASKSTVNKLTHQVEDIRINQLQLKGALNQVISRLDYYDKQIQGVITGTTASTLSTDILNYNRYLQNILANTLANYVQAFSAAMDSKTSPFALSQVEMKEFAAKIHAEKHLTLDTNLNKIRTTAVIADQTIFFFFEVPIISENFHYEFFSIIRVPSFDKNITYWPDVQETNLAIRKDGLMYTILSPMELDRCIDVPPVCQSSFPIIPTSNKETCAISTFQEYKRTCSLRPSDEPSKPFLYFSGSNLYYSVPSNTTLFISCPTKSTSLDSSVVTEQKSVTISGMGEATYRPGCTIKLSSGTYFKTPIQQEIINIADYPLFQLKAAMPHSFDTHIQTAPTVPPIQIVEFTQSSIDGISFLEKHEKKLNYIFAITSILFPLLCFSIAGFLLWKKIRNRLEGPTAQVHSEDKIDDEFQFLSIPLTPSSNKQQQPQLLSLKPIQETPIQLKTTPIPPPDPNFHPIPKPPILKPNLSSQKNVHF